MLSMISARNRGNQRGGDIWRSIVRATFLTVCCTSGNCDDRQPVPDLVNGLTDTLAKQGIRLVTDKRANMRTPDLAPKDQAMLRSCFLIETIFDQLKNDFLLDQTRHRSPDHFRLNLAAALCAYAPQPNKPALRWSPDLSETRVRNSDLTVSFWYDL